MLYNLTIISDWGINSPYNSIFYGELLKRGINTNISVISNNVELKDFTDAYFLFSSSWHHFPENTIHLISVNSNINPENGFLYIKSFNHHFIAPNNGILYPFTKSNYLDLAIYKIINNDIPYSSFYELEYYIFAISNIYNQVLVDKWAQAIDDPKNIVPYFLPTPFFNKNIATGEVIHIDHFGNIITNFDIDFFKANLLNHKWQISLRHYKIYNLYNGYSDVEEQNIFAFFNSQYLLELGIKGFNASELLGVKKGDKIYIQVLS